MPMEILLRFYEELNDYLGPEKRKREFAYPLTGNRTVEQVLLALGIPVSEVEIVLVNSTSVDLAHCLKSGDRLSVYPVFESFDVNPVLQIRRKPLRTIRFAVEPKLRRLAFYLRLLGFEASVDSRVSDAEENREVALTTDAGLLKSGLSRVCVVRETRPRKQLKEVLSRLQLSPPFFHVLRISR